MRISYKNINLIGIILLFIIFIYTPQFIVFGFVINTLYVFPLISIYVLTKNNYKLKFPRWLLGILITQVLFFVIMSLYNGYLETFFLKEIFIFPFVFISGQFIYERIIKLNYSNYDLVKFIMIALIINFLIIIVFSVFRELNTYLHSFINITPKQFKYIYDTPWIRHSGISVSGFSNLSFKAATLYCIVFSYFVKERKISYNFIFLSIVLIIANIFIARIGLFMIALLFLISCDEDPCEVPLLFDHRVDRGRRVGEVLLRQERHPDLVEIVHLGHEEDGLLSLEVQDGVAVHFEHSEKVIEEGLLILRVRYVGAVKRDLVGSLEETEGLLVV